MIAHILKDKHQVDGNINSLNLLVATVCSVLVLCCSFYSCFFLLYVFVCCSDYFSDTCMRAAAMVPHGASLTSPSTLYAAFGIFSYSVWTIAFCRKQHTVLQYYDK